MFRIFILLFLLIISVNAQYYGPTVTREFNIIANGQYNKTITPSEHKVQMVKYGKLVFRPGFSVQAGTVFQAGISKKIPKKISITGPTQVYEGKNAIYTCSVESHPGTPYAGSCKFYVSNDNYAYINEFGHFTAKSNIPQDVDVSVIAVYDYNGFRTECEFNVTILKLGITDIACASDHDSNTAKNILANMGYKFINNVDLNRGCGSDTMDIYLGYKKEYLHPSQRVTGIAVIAGPDGVPVPYGYKAIWNHWPTDQNGCSGGNTDANKGIGWGSAWIWLSMKKDASRSPISELYVVETETCAGYEVVKLNLNWGSYRESQGKSGDPLYLAFRGGEAYYKALGQESDYTVKDSNTPYYQKLLNDFKNQLEAGQEKFEEAREQFKQIQTSFSKLNEYSTNKWDKRDEIYNADGGGWVVAWGREITETDLIEGAAILTIDIASGNPTMAGISYWVENLVQESTEQLMISVATEFPGAIKNEIANRANSFLNQLISELFEKGSVNPQRIQEMLTDQSGLKVEFKAGVASYSGHNVIAGIRSPNTVSWQPYIAIRFSK